MLSLPTAVPERQVLYTCISVNSSSFAASKNIELTSFMGKNELCDFCDTGILLAKLGPMLEKYLLLWIGNFLRIALNMDGKLLFSLFLFKIFNFSFSVCFLQYKRLATPRERVSLFLYDLYAFSLEELGLLKYFSSLRIY